MRQKKILRSVLIGGAFGLALALAGNLLRWASPADYVNVALVPALAEEIGADLPTRLALAHEGEALLRRLGASPRIAGAAADERGREDVAAAGQRVFDLLTVEQRKAFLKIFRSGEAARVGYHTVPPADGKGFALYILDFGWPDAGGGEGTSAPAVQRELERAWKQIPSPEVARELEQHPHEGVQQAAARWLARNDAAQKRASTRASFEERRRKSRAEHRARVEQMEADFEERRARSRDEHDKRVEEMRERHEQRVREARARSGS